MTMEEFVKSAEVIEIVSGEGEFGTKEEYTGARTVKALKARLTKERGASGDRWAYYWIDGLRYNYKDLADKAKRGKRGK